MSKYLDIDDDNFYSSINKIYSRYKIPKEKKTLRQICFPTKYEFQIPQKFLAEFINPKTPYKGIMVYHRIGAGKTCTAINIAEKFKHTKNIMVVLPASLKGNFRSELRSLCAGQNYLTDRERVELKKLHPSEPAYREIIEISDARIDKYYTIYSYNKFVDLLKQKKLSLRNTLLIIDEIQNMVSDVGSYYSYLYEAVHTAPSTLRLVIMSATPIFDKPAEIGLTLNLLLRDRQLPVGSEFYNTFVDTTFTQRGAVYSVKNMDLFKQYAKGYVSFYAGAPKKVFPARELHIVKTKMSDFQERLYRRVEIRESGDDIRDYLASDIPNSFFIGLRMISNFTYPNKKLGKAGYDSLEEKDLAPQNLAKFSPKMLKILRKIRRAQGTLFVYSNFKEFGGIYIMVRILEHYGYKNYQKHGAGRKRFAVFSGDEDIKYKDEIKAVFNNKNNEDGSQIKIILGSSAIKEGISLLRIQEIHILEPYWNLSRIEQVIGRGIRYCSHKDVQREKRLVKVYIYLAMHPKIKISVDQKIMNMAITKQLINAQFEKALKESAVDCTLFHNANVQPGEDDIICDT